MSDNIQIHEKNGKPVSVTMPYKEYRKFLELQEDMEDIAQAKIIKARIESGEEECFPAEIVHRMIDESPIRVFREYRGFTQQKLADEVGIKRPYLAEIEAGKKKGSVTTLKAIAKALNLDLDDIV